MTEIDWVDQLIATLNTAINGVLTVQIAGQPVVAQITDSFKTYIITNQNMFRRIGLDTFRDFMYLIHEKKEEQAFDLLLNKMSADDLIARLNADANELSAINDNHDAFISSLEVWVKEVAMGVGTKVVIGLLAALVV